MKKWALVVGVSKYGDPKLTDRSFAAQDAREVICLVHTEPTQGSGGLDISMGKEGGSG